MAGSTKKVVESAEREDTIVKKIEKLTALDAFELKKALEEKFGVTAAVPSMALGVARAESMTNPRISELANALLTSNYDQQYSSNIFDFLMEIVELYVKGRLNMTDIRTIYKATSNRVQELQMMEVFFSGVWVGSALAKIDATLDRGQQLADELVLTFQRIEKKMRGVL